MGEPSSCWSVQPGVVVKANDMPQACLAATHLDPAGFVVHNGSEMILCDNLGHVLDSIGEPGYDGRTPIRLRALDEGQFLCLGLERALRLWSTSENRLSLTTTFGNSHLMSHICVLSTTRFVASDASGSTYFLGTKDKILLVNGSQYSHSVTALLPISHDQFLSCGSRLSDRGRFIAIWNANNLSKIQEISVDGLPRSPRILEDKSLGIVLQSMGKATSSLRLFKRDGDDKDFVQTKEIVIPATTHFHQIHDSTLLLFNQADSLVGLLNINSTKYIPLTEVNANFFVKLPNKNLLVAPKKSSQLLTYNFTEERWRTIFMWVFLGPSDTGSDFGWLPREVLYHFASFYFRLRAC